MVIKMACFITTSFRLVQQQRLKIMEYYERKEKQVDLQKKIQSSNMLNQARLKVLKHRDDHVASVLDDAKVNLGGVTKDKKKYTEILQQLLTQGMCQLLEPALLIRCRQVDQGLVESIIPASTAEYKAKVNKECLIKLDTENWIPAERLVLGFFSPQFLEHHLLGLEVLKFLLRRGKSRLTTLLRPGLR